MSHKHNIGDVVYIQHIYNGLVRRIITELVHFNDTPAYILNSVVQIDTKGNCLGAKCTMFTNNNISICYSPCPEHLIVRRRQN